MSKSSIITKETKRPRKTKMLPPIHAGEILREEFMKPLGISINQLARDLRVPVTRMSEIVNERRGITADTALRLARYFNNSVQFWINLQKSYEIEVAERSLGETIARDVRPRHVA
jgi:addiction module HigA family antidote